ncbi:hypothetical protein LOTGIDRAFT_159926 [Lottia gigantea]|uniref:DEX1 C-terminal domain-containing protein n=1 Tax=Lottia gigantea TaxID=225164 RepID=V4ANZ2_LOTGI|nr:hypothetical protein LOTGIDRAFT_159926 [Lottia gigantea]ESO96510.1 hypothetical protein LOTGIDRAFT_159926 [Lottia gigantea]
MFILKLLFSWLIIIEIKCNEDYVASKLKSEESQIASCRYLLQTLWHTEISHTPFSSAPLIADVDADGELDIVVSPFSEVFNVVRGETGRTLVGEKFRWPVQNLNDSVHSSPIQFDYNGDGVLDLIFTTTSGQVVIYQHDTKPIGHFQIPPVLVLHKWYEQLMIVPYSDLKRFIPDHISPNEIGDYIPVDSHVYSTPVLADLNNDGRVEELVIPVTYLFDSEDYRDSDRLKDISNPDLEDYLIAGIVVLNLTKLDIIWTAYLGLSQISSAAPTYNLFTPTVIDLDGESSDLEIIVGTSSGEVHVLTSQGQQRKGFPYDGNPLHGQITVADVNNDRILELITIDTNGNVKCLTPDGSVIWESETGGTSSPGSRIADLNQDDQPDIIIPTNTGDIYVLNGTDGSILPGWPVRFHSRITANVLLMKFTPRGPPDLVFTTEDGSLHILAGDQRCKVHIPVGETSLVEVLSHDLVIMSEGVELLVATRDGSLICLGSGLETPPEAWIGETMVKRNQLISWPSATKSINDFSFIPKKPVIYIPYHIRYVKEITGNTFWTEFEIMDDSITRKSTDKYYVKIYYGSNLLLSRIYDKPGVYKEKLHVWAHPGRGHVTIRMTNHYGQVFTDSFAIRFNKLILQDLQWLLLSPFVAMVIILLVNHGFPAKDLLPVTFQSKTN